MTDKTKDEAVRERAIEKLTKALAHVDGHHSIGLTKPECSAILAALRDGEGLEKWERLSMEHLAKGLRERGDDLSTDAASWLEKFLAPPTKQPEAQAVAWISWSAAFALREAHENDAQVEVTAWAKPRGLESIPLCIADEAHPTTPAAEQPEAQGEAVAVVVETPNMHGVKLIDRSLKDGTKLYTAAPKPAGGVIGYLTQSALDALRECRNDDYNGTVELWMRPQARPKADIPVYLTAAQQQEKK